jgi:Holliday junction resolvase RusA-like endonuclease
MDPKYVAAKGAVANHLRLLLRGSVDAVGRYSVTCTFYCETLRRRDLDRLLSLILDAAEGIVYANDSQVDEFGPTRKIIGLPRGAGKTEITIKKIVG